MYEAVCRLGIQHTYVLMYWLCWTVSVPQDDGPSPSKRTKPPTLISVASRLNQEEKQSRTGEVVEVCLPLSLVYV